MASKIGSLLEFMFNSTQYIFQLVTQSSLTLCDPMDCSPPGSSLHGILQQEN